MQVTITTHNGSAVRQGHNMRTESVVVTQTHIDPNGHFEIWKHEPVRAAYHRLFDAAVERYNQKQKRADRKKTDYYKEIQNDSQKHLVYEMIIGIYGKDSHGNPICPKDEGYKILKEFTDGWQQRNPNLELIGAYYHADEEGEPHVHLDYIPVAHGYKNGMDTQTALVRAFGEQGFEKTGKVTAQIKWEARENQILEALCIKYGFEVVHPDKDKGVEHLHTETYKAKQELKKVERNIKYNKNQLEKTKDAVRSERDRLSWIEFEEDMASESIKKLKREESELVESIQEQRETLEELEENGRQIRTELLEQKIALSSEEAELLVVRMEAAKSNAVVQNAESQLVSLQREKESLENEIKHAHDTSSFEKAVRNIFENLIDFNKFVRTSDFPIVSEKSGLFYGEPLVVITRRDYYRMLEFIRDSEKATRLYQDLIDLASELRSGTSRFRDNWEQAGNEIKNEEIEYYREQLEKAIQEASDNMSEKDKEILELSQKIDQISDEIRRLKEEREEQLSIQAMVTKYLPDEWNRLLQRIDRVQRMETAYDDRYEGVNMYGTITIIPFEGQKYTLARFLEEYKNECEKQGIEMSETLRGNYEIINNKKKEIKPISPIF